MLLGAVVGGGAGHAAAAGGEAAYRGMTVSCLRWGPGEWDRVEPGGRGGMNGTLETLAGLGVDAFAIHPYASVTDDGRLVDRSAGSGTTTVPLRLGADLGMRAMVKPHIGYWGSSFAWRGDVAWEDDAVALGFLERYRVWIVEQARRAAEADADVFAIGTELEGLTHHEAAWRQIVQDVRAVFPGLLTYAANHDSTHKVPFWDALDLVGVQAYHPLVAGGDGNPPTDAALDAGWSAVEAELRELARTHGRPVLLTELGYADHDGAAREPWADGRRTDTGRVLKLRLVRRALRQTQRWEGEPWYAGVFLWKWFPTGRDFETEFVLQYPAMRGVLREAWVGTE